MKIRTNDKVKIMRGKDKGKEGKVIQVFRPEGRVVVEGLNLMKKHMRPRKQGEKGQTIELAAPIRVENVRLVCPRCGRTNRPLTRLDGEQKKRACRKCRELID